MLNWTEKREAMEVAAKYVMEELNINLVDALIKMRETALKKENQQLADDLRDYAQELILGA